MTQQMAINEGYRLMAMWVGKGTIDLGRIQTSIKQDIAWTTANPGRMTRDCLRECRNDRKIVGQLIKNHSWLGK